MYNRRLSLFLIVSFLSVPFPFSTLAERPNKRANQPMPREALDLSSIPYRIVNESFRETKGKENWELCIMNADGSNQVNITQTPDIDEMYPHASPDGKRICFVTDEWRESGKVRSVYYMNVDGSGRVKVSDHARQPCWNPSGTAIAYMKAEFEEYTTKDYATRGLFIYDLATGESRQHVNEDLHHLYNICWSPDGNWFLATVHGGMGFKHAILTFPAAEGTVYDLTRFWVKGCRPEFSPDGKRITWGASDHDICTAEIDFTGEAPTVRKVHTLIHCQDEWETYHADFSPDGKYIAFSYGPEAEEIVGGKAPGWNICVADMDGNWVQITTDGLQNKEPDWIPTAP